jgi:hypothetical protein
MSGGAQANLAREAGVRSTWGRRGEDGRDAGEGEKNMDGGESDGAEEYGRAAEEDSSVFAGFH